MQVKPLRPQTEATLKALSHPERYRLLNLLCQKGTEGATVTAIYTELKLPQAIVSQHLVTMKAHQLVESTKEGTKRVYRILKPEIAQFIGYISGYNEAAATA